MQQNVRSARVNFDGFVMQGWGDFECAAFGSVLAATDPVAVVGLLKARMVAAVHEFNSFGQRLNGFAGRLDEFGKFRAVLRPCHVP